ncbi:hypothetical protein ACFQY4_44090 [Catellatospora bangladeshensis]|uniref:hypothetical protein n=1 Tax=Catellatospora bangladeshensis TaxID=310355 RepID=UPI0036208368
MTTGGIWLANRDNGVPVQHAWREPSPAPSATPAPSTSPASRAIPIQPGPPGVEHADLLESGNAAELVKVNTSAWYSWALMDRKTGTIVGSKNWNQTNMTASMIKAWLAADYLRRAADNGQTPSSTRMNEIRTMIRDSANGPASTLWAELGKSATISRMISICKLTDSRAGDGWSTTRLSARDTCRIAHAIGSGAAAGPAGPTTSSARCRRYAAPATSASVRPGPATSSRASPSRTAGWTGRPPGSGTSTAWRWATPGPWRC